VRASGDGAGRGLPALRVGTTPARQPPQRTKAATPREDRDGPASEGGRTEPKPSIPEAQPVEEAPVATTQSSTDLGRGHQEGEEEGREVATGAERGRHRPRSGERG
jgi:hypothetical protein